MVEDSGGCEDDGGEVFSGAYGGVDRCVLWGFVGNGGEFLGVDS